MAVHGMIDIETLGVDPGCVVLTIGGIKFNPYSNAEPHDGLYIRCNVDEQTELGRTVDENTLAWWNKQDPKIKDEALSDNDRLNLNEVLKQINKFCVGLDYIWCQGPTFDFTIYVARPFQRSFIILPSLYSFLTQDLPASSKEDLLFNMLVILNSD